MKDLFEKYKINHLNTSDGKVFMIHENALQDIAKEYLSEQLRLQSAVGQSELLKAFYAYIDDKWALGMLTDKVDEVIEGFYKRL